MELFFNSIVPDGDAVDVEDQCWPAFVRAQERDFFDREEASGLQYPSGYAVTSKEWKRIPTNVLYSECVHEALLRFQGSSQAQGILVVHLRVLVLPAAFGDDRALYQSSVIQRSAPTFFGDIDTDTYGFCKTASRHGKEWGMDFP